MSRPEDKYDLPGDDIDRGRVRPRPPRPDAGGGGQSLRCSDYARATSLSPVGTSGSYDGYLLVEIPLPWPRDAGDSAEGAALGPLIGPLRYRLQAVAAAEPKADPRERRVILHARPSGEAGFGGYRRFESRVGDSLTGTVAALIAVGRRAIWVGVRLAFGRRAGLHARHRDSCCGRRGASLAADLAAAGFRPGRTCGAPVTWAVTGSLPPSWCSRRAPSGATPTPALSPGWWSRPATSPTPPSGIGAARA